MSGKPAGKGASERLLIIVLAALIGTFVLSAAVIHRMSGNVAELSEALVYRAMPRLADVASLRDNTLEVQLALGTLVHGTPAERVAVSPVVDAELAKLRREVRRNLADAGPDELALSHQVAEALDEFDTAVHRTRHAVDSDPALAHRLFQSELLIAGDKLEERAMSEVALNAKRGHDLTLELAAKRGRIKWLSYTLIALCVVVAGSGLLLLRRQSRQRVALVQAYAQEQEAKVAEMEQFAGRVAHDIRNPLASASLAIELLAPQLDDPQARGTVARLQRSLTRAGSITDSLLEFARAGANPEPGARTNLRDAVEDSVEGFAEEAQRAAIDLAFEPIAPVLVPCSSGVVSSLVGNLVRNAIKYMGTREPRRILVRAVDRGDAIRVEVTDTGPGIAPDLQGRIFEPFFRGATLKQAGLGLGLNTVKKLAEGHGGSVGVRSIVGQGSTFWFELPYAAAAWESGSGLHPTLGMH